MKASIDDHFNYISDLISKEEFENKISNYRTKYSGLLTDEVLAHLIVDELGRNITNFSKIYELKTTSSASLFVSVIEPEPKLFQSQNGTHSGAEVCISDHTGNARLVLWTPQHIALVKDGLIKIGTRLKLMNVKVTKTDYGLDLTPIPDKFETLIIDPPDFPENNDPDSVLEFTNIASLTDDGAVNVLGTIAWKGQLRTFNRKDKSVGHVFNLDLYDGTGTMRITLWDDKAQAAEEYSIGEQLQILNGYSKLNNGVREIHTNYRTMIIIK